MEVVKAIKNNQLEAVKELVPSKYPSSYVVRGEAFVFYTIRKSKRYRPEILEYLLKNGANIEAEAKDRDTLILHAYRFCREAVPLLMQYGANVNAVDVNHQTILTQVLTIRDSDDKKKYWIELLLNHGANMYLERRLGCCDFNLAVETASIYILKLLTSHSTFNPKHEDSTGRTSLHYAVKKQRWEVVVLFRDKGFDVNKADPVKYRTMLSSCAGSALGKIVLELLKYPNIDVNIQDADGNTAMHFAAAHGEYTNWVKELLSKKPDLDLKARYAVTPLFVLMDRSQYRDNAVELMKKLIKAGLNINATNKRGYSYLHLAARAGSQVIVQLLIKHGAYVNASPSPGHRCQYITPIVKAIKKRHYGTIMYLLMKKASLHSYPVSRSGITIVHSVFIDLPTIWRCDNYTMNILMMFKENGVQFNCVDMKKRTPLHYALVNRYPLEIIEFLIQNGCDIHQEDVNGSDALRCAIQSKKTELVEYILTLPGVDINKENSAGLTPICSALESCIWDSECPVIALLLQHGALLDCSLPSIFKFIESILTNTNLTSSYLIKLVVDKGFPIYKPLGQNGRSLLSLVIEKKCFNLVPLLLSKGADAKESGLLHIAIKQNASFLTLSILLKNGADINDMKDNATPLRAAFKHYNLSIFRYLLQQGADYNIRFSDRRTVITFAITGSDHDYLEALIQYGADLNGETKLPLENEPAVPENIASTPTREPFTYIKAMNASLSKTVRSLAANYLRRERCKRTNLYTLCMREAKRVELPTNDIPDYMVKDCERNEETLVNLNLTNPPSKPPSEN